jgi:hypothetical protein
MRKRIAQELDRLIEQFPKGRLRTLLKIERVFRALRSHPPADRHRERFFFLSLLMCMWG